MRIVKTGLFVSEITGKSGTNVKMISRGIRLINHFRLSLLQIVDNPRKQ
jgi:hypothetical protein